MKKEKAVTSEEEILLTCIAELKLLLNELCKDYNGHHHNDEAIMLMSQRTDELISEYMRLKK